MFPGAVQTGVKSCGARVAVATSEDGKRRALVTPPAQAKVGERVSFAGVSGGPDEAGIALLKQARVDALLLVHILLIELIESTLIAVRGHRLGDLGWRLHSQGLRWRLAQVLSLSCEFHFCVLRALAILAHLLGA